MSREKKPSSNIEKAAVVGIVGVLTGTGVLVERVVNNTKKKAFVAQHVVADGSEPSAVPPHYFPDLNKKAESQAPDIKGVVAVDDEADSEAIKLREKKKRALFDVTYYYSEEAQQVRAGMTEDEIRELLTEGNAEKKEHKKDQTEKLLANLKKLLPGISDVKYEHHESEIHEGFAIYSKRLSGHGPIAFFVSMGHNGANVQGKIFDISSHDEPFSDSETVCSADDYQKIADTIKKFYPDLDH